MTSTISLINQGTFGCIFRPGINCKGAPENMKFITKIQKNTDAVKHEFRVGKRIKMIHGYSRFFAPVISQCPVRLERVNRTEINNCRLFDKMSDTELKDTYVSNKIRYVGKLELDDHILSQITLMEFWKELLSTHTYLIKGVARLLSNRIVHYDVKPNNIMYDSYTDNPIFIDFGLSIDLDALSPDTYANFFYTFNTYNYWCIEICVFSYIFREIGYEMATKTLVTKEDLATIANVFIKGKVDSKGRQSANSVFNSQMFSVDTTIETTFLDEYNAFFEKYLDKTWMNLYEDMMEHKTYETWDVYGLAASYLFILEDYAIRNARTYYEISTITKTEHDAYLKLLRRVLFSMPDKRPRIRPVLKELQRIGRAVGQLVN